MTASIWNPGTATIIADSENTNLSQYFTASAGQTSFTLTSFAYVPNASALAVYRNGQRLIMGVDAHEDSSGTLFTLDSSITLAAGEIIEAVGVIGTVGDKVQEAADSAAAAAVSASSAHTSEVNAAASAASAAASVASISLPTIVRKTSDTGSLIGTVGTTAQRDVAPAVGYERWNSTYARKEIWNGFNWEVTLDNPANLVNLLFPSKDGNGRDIARAGWLAPINQQWGGAHHFTEIVDAATGQMYKFEPATGNVQDDNGANVSNVAGSYYVSTGFKVADSATYDSIWLKLCKVGNPTTSLTVRIYSDNGSGSPSAALGSAVTISPKVLTSKTDGEWYRISGLTVALTAGTQYHIVCSTLAAVDASNYYTWKATSNRKYPYGFNNAGTSVPAWTQASASGMCFLVEPPASSAFLQSSGRFDKKLVFGGLSAQPAQQKILTQPLRNFFDGKNFTFLQRLTSVGVSQILFDFIYGVDHDRIVGGTNVSGYPYVTLYTSSGASYSVTGTVSIATGDQDVAIVARTVGDGADYLKLYINGISVGTPLTAQTFVLDSLMREVGNAFVGGGLPLAPTWTQSMTFASLPSAQGWTWTGTGTEANCMSVSGGKLYQNANGYGSTGTGYYAKTTTLVNATGWTAAFKLRVLASTNTAGAVPTVDIAIQDGSKLLHLYIQEYFMQSNGTGAVDFVVQNDFKSQERVLTICGKGTDYYVFIDGKLAIDGTGKLTTVSATNQILFGDNSATASENADVTWAYVKYSNAGMILPTPAVGASLSEQAYWSGDQSALIPVLWNSGAPVSVKKMCGVTKNYIEGRDVGISKEYRKGVTNEPSTSSTSDVLLTDCELYTYGQLLSINLTDSVKASASPDIAESIYVDGVRKSYDIITPYAGGYKQSMAIQVTSVGYLGLHKQDIRWSASGATAYSTGTIRSLIVEAKV